ncbi:uncharacterized protein SAPINGB_P005961 [Magnusiomyces paraingens]|uniref:Uncharacterized protein n=1 Tax=Magnusiomyces paraingens TaxID=2606893 RepID=A0A5E8C7R0_9ASCO|nr:uncharacterized protein SAPINGB_P005961 [Saprochaete ingens]VVT57948.1 unnamed protein product [Saprochaete ingens]
MANASAKKQAIANKAALKQMHLASLAVNGFVFLSFFVLHRPFSLKPFLLFSLPALLLQFQLERMGRPRYDTSQVPPEARGTPQGQGTLVYPGEDLAAEGLTEWLHDVIYVTWFCDILSVIFNSHKVWYLYLSIPIYASYKVYGLIIGAKGGLFNSAAHGDAAVPEMSKRQEKLQKKRQKLTSK